MGYEKPAPFGEQARVRGGEEGSGTNEVHGFFFGRGKCSNPSRQVPEMQVRNFILEEVLCSLGEIRVEGNQRHTDEAIIGFAGLSGKPLFTSALIKVLKHP